MKYLFFCYYFDKNLFCNVNHLVQQHFTNSYIEIDNNARGVHTIHLKAWFYTFIINQAKLPITTFLCNVLPAIA